MIALSDHLRPTSAAARERAATVLRILELETTLTATDALSWTQPQLAKSVPALSQAGKEAHLFRSLAPLRTDPNGAQRLAQYAATRVSE